MEGWRMAWITTELGALWLGLPLLLWLEALPPGLRIGMLAAAAVYGLWIVRRERVPWNRLGFRGPRYLLASMRAGLPWVAGAWPVLVALVAVGPVVGRAAPAPEPEPSLLLALGYYAIVSVSSQEFLYSSFFLWRYRPSFRRAFSPASTAWPSPSPTSCTDHGSRWGWPSRGAWCWRASIAAMRASGGSGSSTSSWASRCSRPASAATSSARFDPERGRDFFGWR